MNRPLIGCALALAMVTLSSLPGHADQREDLRDFMHVKLKYSESALEGLVLNDFQKVAKAAQEMSLLSLAETWQVMQTPEYIDFSRKFRNAADALTEAARKRKLEDATTAYNRVTTSCVNCHKYVRDVQMAKAK